MRKAIRILAVAVLSALIFTLCACGDEATENTDNKGEKTVLVNYGTLIYGSTDLSEYVTLGNYKDLSVDTSSEEYKSAYTGIVQKDINSNNIVNKTVKGKVKDGDTVNIDYEGKRDGVAFQGGTAKGYDLKIGSGTFIPGFESGLIGVNIGDTVDLNLKFPENYGKSDLAGAAVVFTVKVNYVKNDGEVKMEDHYSELGFTSFEEYEQNTRKRTVGALLFEKVLGESVVKGYPEKDKKILVNAVYDYYDNHYKKNYNMDFATVLSRNNMTKEDFINQRSASADTQMKDQMIYYSILRAENLKAEYELTEKEKLGQGVLDEITQVEKAVKDFLYNNADIK